MLEFIQQMFGTNWLEVTAVIFGLLCVWLTIKRSMHSYTFGIPMAIMYMIIFYQYKLYSDALLQIFFVVVQIYGIYVWINNLDNTKHVKVEPINSSVVAISIQAGMAFWIALSWLMHNYTDATHPAWDSFIAAASVVAQFWLSRRYIESWLLWMVVDIAAIPLFFVKGLTPTAALYGVFLLMTFKGYYDWRKAANV